MAEPGRTGQVLLDTGPLVALLSSDDDNHDRCRAELGSLRNRPITCWPVLTEAAWLLRARKVALERLLDNVDTGMFEVAELPRTCGRWLSSFVMRYHDVGVQLADAALVLLAETLDLDTVFTLDRRDFSVYRTTDGRALKIIPFA